MSSNMACSVTYVLVVPLVNNKTCTDLQHMHVWLCCNRLSERKAHLDKTHEELA
jgi:hypothetical protein